MPHQFTIRAHGISIPTHGTSVALVSCQGTVDERRYAKEGEDMKRALIVTLISGAFALYRRAQKHQDAKPHLAAAASLFRDMEVRFWASRAS
jgi:hypothetical protein